MSRQTPWRGVYGLPANRWQALRQRAIFDCCKWDPQVEDVSTLAPFVVILKQEAWRELATLAEALAAETLALEAALLRRPELFGALGLPRAVRRILSRGPDSDVGPEHLRVMRFDFHPTSEGWRISEANTDVPGGYNEASGFTALMGEAVLAGRARTPSRAEGALPGRSGVRAGEGLAARSGVRALPCGLQSERELPRLEAIATGDPAGQLASEICDRLPPGGTVALVHATGYIDDRQVMVFLARLLEGHGLNPVLAGPDHIRWTDGRARIQSDWFVGEADFVFRFFPGEWLSNLASSTGWPHFFRGSRTPLCNPATALVTQSKRVPLVWEQLETDASTWRRLLPETRDPRQADWRRDPAWVLKPALGRVGDMIGLAGVTSERDWKQIRSSLRWHPGHWIAQRRFHPMSLAADGQSWHICFGVYTVNGRAAGIYGRLAAAALINHLARDVAVLVESDEVVPKSAPVPYEPLYAV